MKISIAIVPLLGFLGVCVLLMLWDAPSAYLSETLSGLGPFRYAAFILVLALAVVVAPLSAMPVIPMAAMTLGPFATALCSIAGWTLGAVGAFLIARYVGRPALTSFVSFEKVDTFTEAMSPRSRFLTIVLLRLVTPVELASYALGLSKNVGLVEYTAATAIGVTWFSFAFAYLGEAFIAGNARTLLAFGGASAIVFAAAWYLLHRTK